ncbi:MAG: flippase-like domain-containing protein [Cytophagales bacterium]|jgi:uncharacterized protein (TIRG00374 family)|nr:flippase-like domain-containing protein [Cytophagales bacterium]
MGDDIHEDQDKALNVLNVKKIWVPIIISLLLIAYLLWSDPNFTLQNFLLVKDMRIMGLLGAMMCLLLRDGLYVWRIYLITEKSLSWKNCLTLIILWEFASAVTPSAAGGAFVVIFLFMNIGVSLGKSLAYVMSSAVLDNLFFIALGPFCFIHAFQNPDFALAHEFISYPFWISYILITIYTEFMGMGLFFFPNFFQWLMIKITSLGFLKKYKQAAIRQGEDIILASESFGKKSFSFWVQIISLTFVIWTARYVTLNCLASAFVVCNFSDHLDIFCKHLIMWVTMLISPTPGGSGTAEYIFNDMYGNSFGKYTMIISLLWRLFSYYVYLIAGAFILPKWIKKIKKL